MLSILLVVPLVVAQRAMFDANKEVDVSPTRIPTTSPTFKPGSTVIQKETLPPNFDFVKTLDATVNTELTTLSGFDASLVTKVAAQVDYSKIIGPMFVTDAKITPQTQLIAFSPQISFTNNIYSVIAPMYKPSVPLNSNLLWTQSIFIDKPIEVAQSIKIRPQAALQTAQALLLKLRSEIEVENDAGCTSAILALQGKNSIKIREGGLFRTGVITVRGWDDEVKTLLEEEASGDDEQLESYISGSFAVLSRNKVEEQNDNSNSNGGSSFINDLSNVEVANKATLVLGGRPANKQSYKEAEEEPNTDPPSKENVAVVLARVRLAAEKAKLALNQYTEFAPGSHLVGRGDLKLRPGFGAAFDMTGKRQNDIDEDENEPKQPGVPTPIEVTGTLDLSTTAEEEEEAAQPVVPPDLNSNTITFKLGAETGNVVLAASGRAKFNGATLKLSGLKPGTTYKFVHGEREGKFKAVYGVPDGGAHGIIIVGGKIGAGKKRNTGVWVIDYEDSATTIGEGLPEGVDEMTSNTRASTEAKVSETMAGGDAATMSLTGAVAVVATLFAIAF